jgi:hypothetical protein
MHLVENFASSVDYLFFYEYIFILPSLYQALNREIAILFFESPFAGNLADRLFAMC